MGSIAFKSKASTDKKKRSKLFKGTRDLKDSLSCCYYGNSSYQQFNFLLYYKEATNIWLQLVWTLKKRKLADTDNIYLYLLFSYTLRWVVWSCYRKIISYLLAYYSIFMDREKQIKGKDDFNWCSYNHHHASNRIWKYNQ